VDVGDAHAARGGEVAQRGIQLTEHLHRVRPRRQAQLRGAPRAVAWVVDRADDHHRVGSGHGVQIREGPADLGGHVRTDSRAARVSPKQARASLPPAVSVTSEGLLWKDCGRGTCSWSTVKRWPRQLRATGAAHLASGCAGPCRTIPGSRRRCCRRAGWPLLAPVRRRSRRWRSSHRARRTPCQCSRGNRLARRLLERGTPADGPRAVFNTLGNDSWDQLDQRPSSPGAQFGTKGTRQMSERLPWPDWLARCPEQHRQRPLDVLHEGSGSHHVQASCSH
jgi:hypothetical protein